MVDETRNSPKDPSMALWTHTEEELLAGWAERASGYRWLHDQTSKHYDKYNKMLEIPVSILSYLSGGAILSGTMGDDSSIRFFIGTISILGGVLTNVQTALRWKELAEKHRLVGNLFSAYHRNITAELSLDPLFRIPPIDYIRQKRTEFDRLVEQSPPVPPIVIAEFNAKFREIKMAKPDITNGIHPVIIYRTAKISPTGHPKDSVALRVNASEIKASPSFSSPDNASASSSPIPHPSPNYAGRKS
jgi:hypothetical protein